MELGIHGTGETVVFSPAPALPGLLPAPPDAAAQLGRVARNAAGTFCWCEQSWRAPLAWPQPSQRPEEYLRLLYGVGPATDRRLRREGWRSIPSLVKHPRWGRQASLLEQSLQNQEWAELVRRGLPDGLLLGIVDPGQAVFLDIETCGLESTQPAFLVGLAWWEEKPGCWRLLQLLARDYSEEAAILTQAAGILGQFRLLFTFNGKSFDVRFLRERVAYYGLELPASLLHVDLLPHARRWLRPHLRDCRLATIQAEVLGEPRPGDIPGSLVPEYYRRYVETGDAAWVVGILYHNALDLKAMSQLLPYVQAMV